MVNGIKLAVGLGSLELSVYDRGELGFGERWERWMKLGASFTWGVCIEACYDAFSLLLSRSDIDI